MKLIGIVLFSALGQISLCGELASILEPVVFNEEEVLNTVDLREEKLLIQKPHKVFHLNSTDVISEFASCLIEQFNIRGELKLTLEQDWKELVLDANDYAIEFYDYPSDKLKSSFQFSFKVISKGEEIGRWRLKARCELWKNVFFAKQRLGKGSELNHDCLGVRQANILSFSYEPVTDEVDLDQYELDTTVRAGKPILWKGVISRPDIRSGKLIEVVAQEGNLKISTKGIALQSGSINDFIKIRNMESKRPIEGQIIDENTVKVYF